MTDSMLPHAPSLDEPLEMLEACHDRIEAQLKTLERLLEYLPLHGADDQARQAAQNVMRYFDLAGANHHEDEEKNLFPRLLRRAAKNELEMVRSLVSELLGDHIQMSAALNSVRNQLASIIDGTSIFLEEAAVRRVTALYRGHIEKENRYLLPLARRLLNPEDIGVLSRAMTARRSPSNA
ncbi:hemerythrin domain-containing protein [Propionivibrio dicarboxylicus]|uniref:Hemerythrin HHE cation binding domain-containing protein n=1 Tax=Propionivibrio dicarboxylicus TaxID=83767 RepID=A0A1G8F1K2_9RHOO|nr:hemerythrin domain-containing protein [Propionivibrio dicarboxylicus]SDH75879.1 Hemerythrin HHE cation binding domain-containing protein [Propionivibrio dicarboxylicus]